MRRAKEYRLATVAAAIMCGGGLGYAMDGEWKGPNTNCALIGYEHDDGTVTYEAECCDPGMTGSNSGGVLMCVGEPGVFSPHPFPWTPVGVPPVGGGGGGGGLPPAPKPPEPTDDNCKEGPSVPPTTYSVQLTPDELTAAGLDVAATPGLLLSESQMTALFKNGILHGRTLAELAAATDVIALNEAQTWDEWKKTNGTTKPPECNDKKKAECENCDTTRDKRQEASKKHAKDCKAEAAVEAVDNCLRGILPNGQLVGNWVEAQACETRRDARCKAHPDECTGSNAEIRNCEPAIYPKECDWLGDCEAENPDFTACVNGYVGGNGEYAERWGVKLGATWQTPIPGLSVTVGGEKGGEYKWSKSDGTIQRCEAIRQAEKTTIDKLRDRCKAAVEKKYPGGKFTCG